jgi:hypothetical protein
MACVRPYRTDLCRLGCAMIEKREGTILATDFQALSLFRIVFAIYLLTDFIINNSRHFEDFYGEYGILPVATLVESSDLAGIAVMGPLLVALESIRLPALLPYLYPVALVAFAVGYRTRWANAAAFLFSSYLYWRNPYIRYGADSLANLMLLWCLFLPMGRYWSIDSALDPSPRNRPYPALPFLAIRLQVCSVYVFAALYKLAGEPWREGTAVAWALRDNLFGGTPAGLYLVEHAPWLVHYLTYLIIPFQLAFPLLVFSPWRNNLTRGTALLGAAIMHITFLFFLNIGSFPFISLTILLLLVPDVWIDYLLHPRRARLGNVKIYYEPDCAFCRKVALVLRGFLLPRTASVLPASADPDASRLLAENQSWVVRDADGTSYLKWRAIAYLFKENLFLAPLGQLMDSSLLARPMEKLYDLIGRNRRRFSILTNTLLPFRTDPPIGQLGLVLCALLIGAAFACNVNGIARIYYERSAATLTRKTPDLLDQVVAVLQVRQRWNLFAPVPSHSIREYHVLSHMSDGSTTDLMTILPRPLFRTRLDGSGILFPNHHWQKYFSRIDKLPDYQWQAFGLYLCRRARATKAGAMTRAVELIVVTRLLNLPAANASPHVFRTKVECADALENARRGAT